VQTVANTIPLPDYVLDEVRSIPGVKYAVPLYSGGALLKLRDGTYHAANVVGLDDTSLFGRPQMIAGNIQDIFAENAFIAIRDAEFYKLENPAIGTGFELRGLGALARRGGCRWHENAGFHGTATAKTQMVVRMAVRIENSRSVPERRPPAAPILVRPIGIKDEPGPLHLRIPQGRAAPARHLFGR